MFPETIDVCNLRIKANSNLVKAMIAKPIVHSFYEISLYACARRAAHFAFYLNNELRIEDKQL